MLQEVLDSVPIIVHEEVVDLVEVVFLTNYKEKCKSFRWNAKSHKGWIAHRTRVIHTIDFIM